MKRVLLVLGLGGFGALIAAMVLPLGSVIVLALICVAAAVIECCRPAARAHRRAYAAGLFSAAVALCLFAQKEAADYRPVANKAGQTVFVTAAITEPPTMADEHLYTEIRVISGDLKTGARLTYAMPWNDEPPAVGDTVTGTVRLGVLDETGDLSGKAAGLYLYAWPSREDAVVIRPADPADPASADVGERLTAALRTFRERAHAGLTAALPSDTRAVVSAICLGDRSAMTGADEEAFRRSGVSHLLVVSGLHVSLIAAGLYALCRRLRCRPRTAAVIALIGLVLFGCLIGWHASIVRACVLNGAVLLGRCFRRRADSLNSLGGGLLVLWLHDPFCVYDVGLWLTFGATVGLIFLYPWLWKRVSARLDRIRVQSRVASVGIACIRGASRVVCVTLAATLPTLPMVACCFGDVSLVSPLTNLLAVWAAAAILYLSFASLILCGAGLSFAATFLEIPTTALTRYLLWVTRTLSGLPGAVWNTCSLYKQVWIIGGLALLWLGWRLCRKRGLRLAALVCVVVLCAGTLLHTVRMRGVTAVTAYNRYGQIAVVAERDGHSVVIVSGCAQSWKAAVRVLHDRDVAAVDEVIVTDPSRLPTDEWADFDGRVQVGRYWLTEFQPDSAARLLTGHAPVSVAAWNGDDPVPLWSDSAWQWDRETDELLLIFGDTRLWIGEDLPEDGSEQTLRLATAVWTDTPRQDDTPLPGRRQVWYTYGEGTWIQ